MRKLVLVFLMLMMFFQSCITVSGIDHFASAEYNCSKKDLGYIARKETYVGMPSVSFVYGFGTPLEINPGQDRESEMWTYGNKYVFFREDRLVIIVNKP